MRINKINVLVWEFSDFDKTQKSEYKQPQTDIKSDKFNCFRFCLACKEFWEYLQKKFNFVFCHKLQCLFTICFCHFVFYFLVNVITLYENNIGVIEFAKMLVCQSSARAAKVSNLNLLGMQTDRKCLQPKLQAKVV